MNRNPKGCLALGAVTFLCAVASAQEHHGGRPVYVEAGPVVTGTLYADGRAVESPTWRVWRPMCGSDVTDIDEAWLRRLAQRNRRAFDGTRPITVLSGPDVGTRGGPCGGLDIVYNLSGSIPAGAAAALEAAAQYIECQLTDPVTVVISVSFADLGEGVIGGASLYFSGTGWPNVRPALITDMDADDTIQTWLPNGTTVPVRWDAGTSVISDYGGEIYITLANWLAVIGPRTPTHGSMTFNDQYAFDFDPADGVDGDKICFQTVVVHEVTHVLGFVSGLDVPGNMWVLDLYRFQRTDGAGTDWNPDTLAEFQTTARTIDFNNPDDDVISDLISVEYRMSDGSPYQASHFRFQPPPPGSPFQVAIGLMTPALTRGETFWPNFYRPPDLALLDAIGWDYVATAPGDIDGDGDVDELHQGLFLQVLLGIDTGDPEHIDRSDLDASGTADGGDIQPFVEARLN